MSEQEIKSILDSATKQSLLEILSEEMDVNSMLNSLPSKELIIPTIRKQLGIDEDEIPNQIDRNRIDVIYSSLKNVVGMHLAEMVKDILMRPILLNELKNIPDIDSLNPIESKRYLIPLLDFEESYVNTENWKKAATLLEIAETLVSNITGSIKPELETRINSNWGIYFWKRGKYDLSKSKFEKALELAQEVGDKKLLAKVYHGLGVLYGDYAEDKKVAIRYNEKCIKILSELDESDSSILRMKASVFNNIGVAYHKMEDLDSENKEEHLRNSAKNYDEALKFAREIGYSYMEGWVLFNAGEIYAFLGDLEKAENYLIEARDIFEQKLPNDRGLSGVEMLDSVIYMQKGEFDNALESINKSLELRERLKEPRRIADALVLRGDIYVRKNEVENAKSDYETALRIYDSIGSKDSIKRIEEKLEKLFN